ncbi:MAG: pyridoxine 5-phosphate synthase [Planctomycetota bacterium]|jgi:pyridoxine 5-phosphate synthase
MLGPVPKRPLESGRQQQPDNYMPRLHINIDHIATVRQARREAFPDPTQWALRAEAAGALGITCHLRVDRRHIQDADVFALREAIGTRLNLELSLAPEIVEIALASRADAFCLVPENRAEVTTEGGLNVIAEAKRLASTVPALTAAGGDVSLFIDPKADQVRASADAGAMFVELHTGRYALTTGAEREEELARLHSAASLAQDLGLRVNAGHGLDYDNVQPVALLAGLEELNIGFAIVTDSLFNGVDLAVGRMADLIRAAETAS